MKFTTIDCSGKYHTTYECPDRELENFIKHKPKLMGDGGIRFFYNGEWIPTTHVPEKKKLISGCYMFGEK